MVLVKRNNFYFFEKGAQMKSQNSLNLLEKCFSKTFDKEMSILNSNSRVYTNPQNIFFDSTIEKPTNSLDSVFMNSFTVNKITPTKKLLEILKLSENFQESNKIFENYRKFKQKNTIKTRFTQKEPLVKFITYKALQISLIKSFLCIILHQFAYMILIIYLLNRKVLPLNSQLL